MTQTRQRAPRARILSRCAVALVMMLAPALAPVAVARADSSAASVTVTGLFTPSLVRPGYLASSGPYAATLGLYPDAASKSLITVDSGTPAYAAAYDERTMRARPGSARLLDGAVTAVLSTPQAPGLFVALASASYQPATAIEHIQVVNGKIAVTRRVNLTGQLTAGQTVVGLAIDPGTTTLFAMTVTYSSSAHTNPTPIPGTVELAMVDSANGKVTWHQSLSNCDLPMQTMYLPPPPVGLSAPIGVVRKPHVVDVGCSAQSPGNGTTLKAPIPLGVGIVTLSGSGDSATYKSFTIDPYPGDATSAPAGVWISSAERMAIQVLNNVHGGGWALFDGVHTDYVGTVPLPQAPLQVGVDQVHGRLYLLDAVTSAGLVAADAAVTPADQGHSFPEYAQDPINEDNDHGHTAIPGTMTVDPATGRAFLLYAGSHTFVVVHDNFPYYTPPTPPNVDAATAGIPEVPGQTGANYSGAAQGYGSIIRQVGGEASLQYNLVPFGTSGVFRGTRQLGTSYLDTLTLTNSSAQATLITAVPDEGNTQAQMSQGGATWPYAPVACVDFGSGHRNVPGDGGVATCDAASASVSGSIAGGSSSEALPGQSIPDVVAIDDSNVTTSSKAEFGKGMTTKVHASASGISILGGILRIGQVSVDTVAHANGRARGAYSTFTRSVHNVTLNGAELCTSQCDVNTIADTVNSEFVGHIKISFPEPDPTLRGSPGGYQALSRRDPYAQAEEANLDDQPPTRSEVPGMEITIFEDNTQSSRTIVYLAGTEAEAHYGIYALNGNCATCPPSGGGDGGGGGGGAGPSGPSVPGSVTPGTTISTPGNGQPPVLANGANVGGYIKHGWELLLSGIGNALREFGVWLVLLLPVYLSARRWALANRHGTPPSGSA